MLGQIPPPDQVITLVLASWLAGLTVLAALTRVWREVAPGHYKVVWLVAAGLGAALGFLYRPGWVVAAASLVAFAAVYRKLDLVAGMAAGALAIAGVVAASAGGALGAATAFAGALLLGSVTNAMLLGHWHLNQPRMGTKPIARLVWAVWAGIAAYLASAGGLVARGRGVAPVAGLTAIAFTVFAAVLTGMVTHLVRTRSIMSATGILYLEILLCFVAVFTGSLAALGS